MGLGKTLTMISLVLLGKYSRGDSTELDEGKKKWLSKQSGYTVVKKLAVGSPKRHLVLSPLVAHARLL